MCNANRLTLFVNVYFNFGFLYSGHFLLPVYLFVSVFAPSPALSSRLNSIFVAFHLFHALQNRLWHHTYTHMTTMIMRVFRCFSIVSSSRCALLTDAWIEYSGAYEPCSEDNGQLEKKDGTSKNQKSFKQSNPNIWSYTNNKAIQCTQSSSR